MPGLVSTHVELKRNLSFSPGFRVSKQIRSKNWIGIESKWVFSQLDVTALKSESWSQWVFSLFLRTFLAAQLILRWPTTVTAKAKTSRQKQKPHGKIKIPHDKTKNLTAKPKTSQQNQILHSKKPNTPRQKQIPTAKPKSFCSLWSIWFFRGIFCLVCREVFCFCCEVFVFAVTRLWATIQLPYDTKEKRFNRDRKR